MFYIKPKFSIFYLAQHLTAYIDGNNVWSSPIMVLIDVLIHKNIKKNPFSHQKKLLEECASFNMDF